MRSARLWRGAVGPTIARMRSIARAWLTAVVASLAILLASAGTALAGEGNPVWCEVEVDLGKHGRSSVQYTVAYEVVSGEFHGFFFHGPQIDDLRPVWDDRFAVALTDDGRRFGVVRGRRDGKQTIELADGAGVSRGRVIFKFRFATDFAASGHIARTLEAGGEPLVVFHWAPSTWDHALEHETVTVRYPVLVTGEPGSTEFLESVRFRTEPFMNAAYRIDYRRNAEGGRFAVLLHKERLAADETFRIQQYVRASVFEGALAPGVPPPAAPVPAPADPAWRPGARPPERRFPTPTNPPGLRTASRRAAHQRPRDASSSSRSSSRAASRSSCSCAESTARRARRARRSTACAGPAWTGCPPRSGSRRSASPARSRRT